LFAKFFGENILKIITSVPDVITTGSSSGSNYGFVMSGGSWTLDKFTSKSDAYSLCTFTGEIVMFRTVSTKVVANQT
jgi:hypothetical protein